jgi:hypothetical protein
MDGLSELEQAFFAEGDRMSLAAEQGETVDLNEPATSSRAYERHRAEAPGPRRPTSAR